ncbi:FAD-dependent oxidoreductase [Pseudonocardia sp. DSM 110487]|uniref:NAD(P)/FAD-dependent oxidoreductase n=1 Tax=Pseudonocardia sp. DSM 110487 TaxID=2865833 RepID=UPI001C697289|nr:FAD-dependent oxidoreductase [Pseudonocardia sp. DSM 110487]QYN33548.1 FAD-dependent oxidoreductase [Pseudonocardia sp. DSM 110487]
MTLGYSRTEHFDCLIVGAGHAGAETAIALRQAGYAGSIGILGDEPVPPYERPAMSKEYLAGKKDFDQLLLRPPEFWSEHDVTLRFRRRVITVDAEKHAVTCHDGTTVGYGVLVWAAGGNPRTLDCPGHDLAGIHTIRNKADCDRLMNVLPHSRRIAVIGGGYVGLEAAAVLSELGKEVTVVETLDRVLARVAAEPVSRFYEAEHRAHGVALHTGTGVTELLGQAGAITGVRLTDDTLITADQVIIGIGIQPAIQPLLHAGAEAAPRAAGVLVDDLCRTTLPDVYCIGDCAIIRGGPGVRIESRHNACEQARTAGKAISGHPEPLRLVPWFWSNQYGLRLQTVGLSLGHDHTVLRGNPGKRSFSLIYLRDGAVIALDCINATRDYVQGRKLVETGARIDPALLADDRTPLKKIAAAA